MVIGEEWIRILVAVVVYRDKSTLIPVHGNEDIPGAEDYLIYTSEDVAVGKLNTSLANVVTSVYRKECLDFADVNPVCRQEQPL